jgi:uncharacterized membrane protein
MSHRILDIHRLLKRTCCYPLMLCTVLAAGFLALRFHFTDTSRHGYYIWNTFLAWVPWLCSVGALRLHESLPLRRGPVVALACVWLAFFPNAPYLVTDFVHFDRARSFAWWYDVGMMLTFAWTGCFLAIVSLRIMQEIVRSLLGGVASWTFVVLTLGLSGIGIYLGRFARLNSWDLLTQPLMIGQRVIAGVLDITQHPRTIGVTLMFSSLLFVCYLTWTSSPPTLVRRQHT